MVWSPQQQDWHRLSLTDRGNPAAESPARLSGRRLGCLLLGFCVLVVVILARAILIESSDGDAYRLSAARPLTRRISSPSVRGRILARDGTPLAVERKVAAIAVHYRYLKGRSQQHALLAQRAGLTDAQWHRRVARIQARVERIAHSVNRKRSERLAAAERARDERSDEQSTLTWLKRTIADALVFDADTLARRAERARPIMVAEQVDYHVVAEGITPEDVAAIRSSPELYPGVRIEQRSQRVYPQGELAAHLIGYLGRVTAEELAAGRIDSLHSVHPDDRLGRLGIERQEDRSLRGERGEAVETLDHRGNVIATQTEGHVVAGRDLLLTIDIKLQRVAETLLDGALLRRGLRQTLANRPTGGGAVVVMDVHSGAILAAASAPRFDPNLFVQDDRPVDDLLRDPAKPLFDRAAQMAIPPGSVFKVLTAVALMENGIDPHKTFRCRGYLHDVDHWRCQLFRRRAIGHGDVNLLDAITRSCNVYFFDRVGQIRPQSFTRWGYRFGFGMPTGCDWTSDAAGRLPTPASIRRDEGRRWDDDDSRGLAVGQGRLTTTPLQIVRMMAAVANGGTLVTPHIASDSASPAVRIEGLHTSTLSVLREGLGRVVSDRDGTAYRTVRLESVAIAGKTGTAQTGGQLEDHSWFAGYAPAATPRVAFVVALEHAGGGAEAAGPVARRIVQRMRQLGYFGKTASITAGR